MIRLKGNLTVVSINMLDNESSLISNFYGSGTKTTNFNNPHIVLTQTQRSISYPIAERDLESLHLRNNIGVEIIKLSYFSSLLPTRESKQLFSKTLSSSHESKESMKRFSGGSTNCCESMFNLGFMQGNNRLWAIREEMGWSGSERKRIY